MSVLQMFSVPEALCLFWTFVPIRHLQLYVRVVVVNMAAQQMTYCSTETVSWSKVKATLLFHRVLKTWQLRQSRPIMVEGVITKAVIGTAERDRQVDRQVYKQTDRFTDRQTGLQTDRFTERQTETDRHTDRDRQVDRQADGKVLLRVLVLIPVLV